MQRPLFNRKNLDLSFVIEISMLIVRIEIGHSPDNFVSVGIVLFPTYSVNVINIVMMLCHVMHSSFVSRCYLAEVLPIYGVKH